jgi:hypothetical protein
MEVMGNGRNKAGAKQFAEKVGTGPAAAEAATSFQPHAARLKDAPRYKARVFQQRVKPRFWQEQTLQR